MLQVDPPLDDVYIHIIMEDHHSCNGGTVQKKRPLGRAPGAVALARRSVQAPIWSGLWAFCDSCSCCPVADRADGAERPLHVLSFSFCCRWPGG